MGILKKSFKNISDYDDTWQVAQGEYNGKPIYIRIRIGLIDAVAHPQYPFQVGIATPLINPTSEGLTTNEEANELFQVEDLLQSLFENNEHGVFVLTITTNGMREFVFYVSEWKPEVYAQKVKEINSQFKERELQFMIQEDQSWDTFKSYS
jgi:hypothetical protein